MSSFLDNVTALIKEKGITKNRMLTDLKLSRNSFVAWKNRGTIPSAETVSAIADYFDVPVDYLLGREKQEFVGHSDGHFYFFFPGDVPPLEDVVSRRGLSFEMLAEKTGISLESLRNCYENYVPTYMELIVIATALNTSTDFLLGRTEEIDPPNAEEQALIRYFRGLSEIDQHVLLGKAAELVKKKNDVSVAADPSAPSGKMAK